MTYEIALYPRQPGQDWQEVLAADEQDSPPMDQAQLEAGVATFRRIEARLREQLTEPVEVWVAEETDGDVLGELTGTESGLQVELYDRSASVSVPLDATTGRAHLHDRARRAVRAIATETGYEAYDPQTGRAFDGLIGDGLEDDELDGTLATGSAAGEGGAAPGGAAGAAATPANPLTDARMDPKMLRRRSMLYLVVGVALLVFSLLRFSAGDTSWLTWLFLGFAGFNLLAGWMMRQLAAQAEQRRAEHPADDDAGGSAG